MNASPDLVLVNARVTTLDRTNPEGAAVAIRDGKIAAVGSTRDIGTLVGPDTKIVDAGERRIIPGLNDSHTHLIRGGLNYNMELRWDGVRSIALGHNGNLVNTQDLAERAAGRSLATTDSDLVATLLAGAMAGRTLQEAAIDVLRRIDGR